MLRLPALLVLAMSLMAWMPVSTAAPPTIVGHSVTDLHSNSATLNGVINPNGLATTAWIYHSFDFPEEGPFVGTGPCFVDYFVPPDAVALGSGSSPVPFTKAVSSLAVNHRYYYCVHAKNADGEVVGMVTSYYTPFAPTATTTAASGITTSAATLNATSYSNGAATTGWFRYSTSNPGSCNDSFGARLPASGGAAIPLKTPDTDPFSVPYSQAVTGLSPSTTYYFCAIAQNSEGTTFGSVVQFTTANPLMVTLAASGITATSATLNGMANPQGSFAIAYFRYGTTLTATCDFSTPFRAPVASNIGQDMVVSGSTLQFFFFNLTGLQPATTYYYCSALLGAGNGFGPFEPFTTLAAAPATTTNAASGVAGTSATLNGAANPNGDTAFGYFRHSTTNPGTCNDSFGTRTPALSAGDSSLGAGTSVAPYSQAISGLTPGATVYFCALARNALGTTFGAVQSFTVAAVAPSASTGAATDVGPTSATLNGASNPGGASTTGWFRYATVNPGTCDDSFGTRTPASGGTDVGAGNSSAPFSQGVTGLAPGTTYHYCALASNAQGSAVGTVASFATTAADTTPDAFAFTDVAGVARGSEQTSNAVAVSGINVPAAVSVVGGQYSIGCNGTFTSNNGSISNGQTVCVRHSASAGNGMPTHTTLTIGGVADTFTSTTIAGFTLTVATTGNGSVAGTGISCPGDCSELADSGTVIALTPTPAAGSAFAGWSGDCSGTGACSVTLTQARNVTATFSALVVYNVLLEGWQQSPYVATAATGSGTATFNPVTKQLTLNLTYSGLSSAESMAHIHGPAARGANAAVLHTLANGSPKTDVVTLTGAQETQLGAGQLYVNIHTASYGNGEIRGQIDALGATTLRTLTVNKSGTGTVTGTTEAGTVVNCGSDCGEAIPHGKVVTLVATPPAGSAFVGWSGGGCSGTGNCLVTMDAAKTVTASFLSPGSDLATTISANPTSVQPNQDVTFTLTVSNAGPEAGAGVATWATIPAGMSFVSATGCTQSMLGQATIVLCLPNTLAVGASQSYTFVLRPAAVGTFTVNATVSSSRQDQVAGNNDSSAQVVAAAADPPRLGNISTRSQVLTGDDVMIAGFIIGGSSNKTVVVRARGPSLADFNIVGFLPNPQLQLFSGPTVIASNDDWQQAGNAAQVTSSGFAPAHSQEAAILMNLAPGAYTAIVTGVGNSTGVAIAEVFEVDAIEVPLVNIATRSRVQTGDNVLIAGIIVQGSGPQEVVIRARGPSLADFNIAGFLPNPKLQIFSGPTVIAENDDWQQAGNAADIQSSGFAPAHANESAVLMTLQPGAYTAIVSGVAGSTGVAIVEVFKK